MNKELKSFERYLNNLDKYALKMCCLELYIDGKEHIKKLHEEFNKFYGSF